MGYFDLLPNIAYPNYEGGNVIAKNIVTRAKVLDSVREAQSAALEYTIEDGEKAAGSRSPRGTRNLGEERTFEEPEEPGSRARE